MALVQCERTVPNILGAITYYSILRAQYLREYCPCFALVRAIPLAPWCRKIEAEFARSVFNGNDGMHLEIDLSGLMRGDFQTRWQAWEIAVKNDILDRNEVREMEG